MGQEALIEPTDATEMTLAEWLDMPEDEPGELVDGRLAEEEVPGYIHEVIVAFLARILGNWAFPDGGLVAGSDAKFILPSKRGRKPDLTVFFPGSQFPARQGGIEVPPDLAVEIVSPSPRDGRRDRVDKVADYAAFGIRYYWIVDPQLRSLEILELGSNRLYSHVLGASSGVLDSLPGCKGLTLDLDELWTAVDRLERRED